MISAIKMYCEAVKVALAGRMAYRADFFISVIISLMFEFIAPLVTLLIYGAGSSFPGWGLYQALLIQSIFMLSKGIAYPFFFGMVYNVLRRVRDGTFDLLLIRPRSILFLTIATEFDSEELGKLAGGLIFFTVAIIHLPLPNLLQWLEFFFLFIISLSVIFSFALFLSGVVFVWVGCSRVYEIFESVSTFGFYPRTIFSKGLQAIVTLIIPVAMIGFLPASVLLAKPTGGILAALVSSIVFLSVGLAFWHWMLGKYTSSGG